MANTTGLIARKQVVKAKKLLLADAVGGVLSVILLAGLVARFETYFGMPKTVVYLLSFVACLYGTYSLCCYLFLGNNPQPYLKFIALANLVYCCFIISLTIYFYPRLTILGLIYFSAEVIIIVSLAVIELAAADRTVPVKVR